MSETIGTTFGRYVVTGAAGSGSLGAVYRARHVELEREAAVKVLRAEVRASDAALAGLRAEAAALARLDHPNVVALYEFVEEPQRAWLAEQWVDGAQLDDILRAHGRLTPEQALGVVAGALAGLAHAHDHGVVHRDVAAANVLADLAGTSMLVDFGLAVPVDDVRGTSGATGIVGTPAYLSPEAARGEQVGRTGDVYSAAALLHHLLAGSPVFPGTAAQMVLAHRDQPAPPLPDHGPALADLLQRALAKDPAVRPPDAGAFLAELEDAAERAYGAGWRARSSIAGLVAATAAAGTGAGALAGAAGSGAPATVVADGLPPLTSVARTAVDTGRRVGMKTVVAAGTTAAVVLVSVLVVLRLTGGDGDDTTARPAADDEAALALSAEEREDRARERRRQRIAALEGGVPTGRYSGPQRITAVTYINGGPARPPADDVTWTLSTPRCSARSCTGTIVSSGGGTGLRFTWDGRSLTITRPDKVVRKENCYDTVTGEAQPLNESAWGGTYSYDYAPIPAVAGRDGTPPTRLTVRVTGTFSDYRLFGDCEWSEGTYTSFRAVAPLTRVAR